MNEKDIMLCVVPQLTDDAQLNPGGQITAANGLVQYLIEHAYKVKILNTVSPSFPPLPLRKKGLQSIKRLCDAFLVLKTGKVAGAIMFTGAGLSLFERLVISLFCKLFSVRNVLFFRNSSVIALMKSPVIRSIMRPLFILPTIVAVQGDRWKQAFVRAGVPKGRLVVIPNWVPPGEIVVQSPKSLNSGHSVHFIFVGWVVEAKGIKTLARAIKILNGQTMDCQVTIVGGGTCEGWLRSTVESAGWDNVLVTGWKLANDVKSYLAEGQIFVLPTHHPEGFPNALLEAMANGLPAISTDVGAIADSLKNGVNGFLVLPTDEVGLARAMRNYIENPDMIKQHSMRTLEVVKQRHDLTKNCGTLLNALRPRQVVRHV